MIKLSFEQRRRAEDLLIELQDDRRAQDLVYEIIHLRDSCRDTRTHYREEIKSYANENKGKFICNSAMILFIEEMPK
jgi:hypothetical protein